MRTNIMRLIRYRGEYLTPMLELHRSAIEGFNLGMSQQQDEADLVAVDDIYLRNGGEFLLERIKRERIKRERIKRDGSHCRVI